MFGRGIDRLGDLVQVASDLDVVQKSGSWYAFGETRLGQGKEKAVEFLTANPEQADTIRQKVYEALGHGVKSKAKSNDQGELTEDDEELPLEA